MDVRSEACASEDTTNTTSLADSNVKQLNQPIHYLWEDGNDAGNHLAIRVRLLRQLPWFGFSPEGNSGATAMHFLLIARTATTRR